MGACQPLGCMRQDAIWIDVRSCLPSLPCGTSVARLLQNNDLQMIVRAHECVMDGFERFAQGHLITLFRCGASACACAFLASLLPQTVQLQVWLSAATTRLTCWCPSAPTAPATAHNPSIASFPQPLVAPPTIAVLPTTRAPSWCWAATWSWCARYAALLAVTCCCTGSPEAPVYLPCCPQDTGSATSASAPLVSHVSLPALLALHRCPS